VKSPGLRPSSLRHQHRTPSIKGGSFQVKIVVPDQAHKAAATKTLRSIAGSKPAAYLYSYRKQFARLGVFLGAATLVGIVSFRDDPEVSVVNAVPAQTEVIQAGKPEAAVASEHITEPTTQQPTISTAPLIGDFGFSLAPGDQSIETPRSVKAKESPTALKPEAIPSPALPAVAKAPEPTPELTVARKEFVEISVQLTIVDGRVAGAQIGNRQPGAEAFEATALHVARQRRYPPQTSRTETVVVRVANQFGRKEP
jgi:hypothetical protein